MSAWFLVLEEANRCLRYDEADLRGIAFAQPWNAQELRRRWRTVEEAQALCDSLPAETLGSFFLGADGQPGPWHGAARLHRGSLSGAWPRLLE